MFRHSLGEGGSPPAGGHKARPYIGMKMATIVNLIRVCETSTIH